MRNDWAEKLADTYPPTPVAFTMAVKKAVAALPARRSSWRLPVPATAAFALALCGIAALLVFGVPQLQAGGLTAGPAQTAAAATPAPTVAPDRLPVGILAAAPTSADGWQVVAVKGKTTWYYRAKTSELAVTEEGKTTTVALDLSQGQAVKMQSFLTSDHGKWVAFAVHASTGDTIWIVTADGYKITVSENLRWVDSYENPIRVDLSDAEMVPSTGSHDLSVETLSLYALFPEGSVYNIYINWTSSSAPSNIKGYMLGGYRSDDEQPRYVPASRYLLGITKGEGGKYLITRGGSQVVTDLRSDTFSLMKSDDGTPFLQIANLFIYRDDPENTLWKLDMTTGKVVEVAKRCVAAGWMDARTCWYTTSDDPAAINRKELIDNVITQIHTAMSYEPTGNGSLRAVIDVYNLSDEDYTIPVSFPCELTFKQDGGVIKAISNYFALKDTRDIYLVSGEDRTVPDGTKPITLKPGDMLQVNLCEAHITDASEYTLEGNVLGSGPIHQTQKLPNWHYYMPGVTTSGVITADRRLAVSFANNSRSTISIPCAYTSEGDSMLPFVCYRLYQGDKEVKRGALKMARSALLSKSRQVEMGETRTLTEVTDQPVLAGLPSGAYRMEGFFEMSTDDPNLPWGMAGWYYFTVEFQLK